QWASYKNVVTRDGFELALADQTEFGTYKNVMDADTFEAALVDQSQWASYKNVATRDGFELALADQSEFGTYKNVIDRDAYELALVDHRVTGALYANIIGNAEFEDALGDRCLTDGGSTGHILIAKCEIR
ncbi:MAG: hypothetical protein OEV28_11200, partial [Nitrospirota bacterium]|nr:hypothetical protein [Nitrospirota bacterium]